MTNARKLLASIPAGNGYDDRVIAEIDKLISALRPFASAAKEYDSRVYPPDGGSQSIAFPLSDCRKAREAIGL